MGYPVIAVVDKRRDADVVWHVHTAPDAPGTLTGAWITDDGEPLLHGTVVLEVGSDQLDRMVAAVEQSVDELRARARNAKLASPSITLPRFDDLDRPDVAEIAETYHGEAAARDAWAHAVAVAQVVEYWHGVESARKMRKYLVDKGTAEARPIPLGRDVDT